MNKGILYIILGAAFWGLFPMIARFLYTNGTDAITVSTMRISIAACFYAIYMLKFRMFSKISKKDLPFFAAFGIISIAGPCTTYLIAIQMLTTAMAAMLLYTAPAFVIILSRIFFKEPITRKKIIALIITFCGCCLVVRVYDFKSLTINATGILFGLTSGITYACLTLFGRKGLRSYNGEMNAMLPTLFAALFMLTIKPPWTINLVSVYMVIGFITVAVIGSVLPYMLYMKGLQLGVEGGNASILANIEPIVATLSGVIVFGDVLEIWQIAGVLLVISGAVIPVLNPRPFMIKDSIK